MIHPLFVLLGVLAVLYAVGRYYATPASRRAAFKQRALLVGGAILLALMVLRGGLNPALAVLIGIGGIGLRVLNAVRQAQTLRGAYRQWKGQPGSGPGGQASQVRTRFIEVQLDHESGRMTGAVLGGRFRGRRLEDLDLAALRSLHAEVASDPQSRAVLDAYLEREHGEQWTAANVPPATSGAMSEQEARRVLGVQAGDGRDAIITAHRRLMQKLHPDRGGSTYLAAQVNEAKRVLLEA